MSEQERDKAGLHKEISSIFKGVPIPQTDGGQEPSGTPAPERTGYGAKTADSGAAEGRGPKSLSNYAIITQSCPRAHRR